MEPLGTALAAPADAADGTIIWESEEKTVNVRCFDDRSIGKSENIYIYPDPAALLSIGKGIRIGIRYNNKIYRDRSKIFTGKDSWYGCNWANCMGWEATFPLKFSVFVEKFGATPSNGQASTLSQYRVLQLDGTEGINPGPAFNYVITGLQNIRFIPCSPNLTIIPTVVDFPRAYSGSAENGKVASTANFTLGLDKNCNTPYTVDAKFTPASGTVLSGLLVPPNNNSVGIRISRADNNTPLSFNKWFKLSDLDRLQPEFIDFNADLIWRAAPIPGRFEAAVIVDMMYK